MSKSSPKPHTDMHPGWIERYMPHPVQPYLKLIRLDRPVGTWLTLIPAYIGLTLGAGGFRLQDIQLYILFFIGGFLVRGAGCVVNDLWDRNLDKKVERTKNRPLAKGSVSVPHAMAYLFFLMCCALVVLLQLPKLAIIVGCCAVIPILTYPLMKRITFWPQAFLGLTFNMSVLIGWFAVNDTISVTPFALYLATLFITIGYDTIYAFQDIRDDLKVGVKSTAIKFQKTPKSMVGTFYVAGFALCAFAFGSYALAALPMGIHMAMQLQRWQPSDPKSGLIIFKSNAGLYLITWIALLAICEAL